MEQPPRPDQPVTQEQETERVENTPLTVAGLKEQLEDLRRKVAEARAAKEKDIEQKISDREALIGESRRNDALLDQATETLDYFSEMRELGELNDPADIQKLEELKTVADSLTEKRTEIDRRIKTISEQPEVFEKLADEAQRENRGVEVKKLREGAKSEFTARVDQLAAEINAFVPTYNEVLRYDLIDDPGVYHTRNQLSLFLDKDIYEKLQKVRKSGKSELSIPDLNQLVQAGSNLQEIRQKLESLRNSLGIFRGKDKAVIDLVLAELDRLAPKTAEESEAWRRKREAVEAEITRMAGEYENIVEGVWGVEDQVDQLTEGKPADHFDRDGLRYSNLGSELQDRLNSPDLRREPLLEAVYKRNSAGGSLLYGPRRPQG